MQDCISFFKTIDKMNKIDEHYIKNIKNNLKKIKN